MGYFFYRCFHVILCGIKPSSPFMLWKHFTSEIHPPPSVASEFTKQDGFEDKVK